VRLVGSLDQGEHLKAPSARRPVLDLEAIKPSCRDQRINIGRADGADGADANPASLEVGLAPLPSRAGKTEIRATRREARGLRYSTSRLAFGGLQLHPLYVIRRGAFAPGRCSRSAKSQRCAPC
jgi:hypothetical protein